MSSPELESRDTSATFQVHLDIFAGPFDLLLRLIGKHQLDITEVALATVTDEFLEHLRQVPELGLDAVTEFLLVAATLVDLKAARLLPRAEVEDEQDLAALEARDLLFSRLLQYRAFRDVAVVLGRHLERAGAYLPRQVSLPSELASALPEVVLGVSPEEFGRLAAAALRPRAAAVVATDHVHASRVSVAEHMAALLEQLCAVGSSSFRALCAGCQEVIEIVARFLALLELVRSGEVSVEQPEAFGEVTVRWTPVVRSAESEGS